MDYLWSFRNPRYSRKSREIRNFRDFRNSPNSRWHGYGVPRGGGSGQGKRAPELLPPHPPKITFVIVNHNSCWLSKPASVTFFGSGPILGPNGQSPQKCILECQSAPPEGPKYSTLATHGSCLRRPEENHISEEHKVRRLMSKCVFRGHRKHKEKVRRRASKRHAPRALLLW